MWLQCLLAELTQGVVGTHVEKVLFPNDRLRRMAPPRDVTPLPRGRHRLTRAQVRASQRGRILDAMAEVVADRGFARMSVADVVARAGVSTKAFYEQFENKEDCFLAAYDAGVEIMVDGLGQVLESLPGDPLERFGQALDVYLALLADERAFARTFLIEVYAAGPQALQRRHAVYTRFVDVIAEVFGAEDDARQRFACEALVGAISSLVTVRVATGAFDELAGLREPIIGLAADHLRSAGLPVRRSA